jgi:hypothetical protein
MTLGPSVGVPGGRAGLEDRSAAPDDLRLSVATAARWREAAIQLDAEQSDTSVDGDMGDE